MSLFGSLQTASNTLQAMQIGLQVTANNIANANTEGFVRERVNYSPAPVQEIGNLAIGLGVQVDSITQVLDNNLRDQLRGANSDLASADIQNEAYKDLEQLLRELSGEDLSTALTDFFGSIQNTLSPLGAEQLSVRNLAILEGEQLAREIRRIDDGAKQLRDEYDAEISSAADRINQLTDEILSLNIRISRVEGGTARVSEAGSLRTQRSQVVNELTELVSATVVEQPSGGLSISVGGEFLVFEGQRREVTTESVDGSDDSVTELRFADTGKALNVAGGKVQGWTLARDEVVGGFRESFDEFSSTLIYEFNRAYSQGQGLEGFSSLTSQNRVTDANIPLGEAGLPFPIENGFFDLLIRNEATGETARTSIQVDALGDGSATGASLTDISDQIDAVAGVSASVDVQGRLVIRSDSDEVSFAFAEDTSGALTALGINTFFTGSGSTDIAINSELDGIENAAKFASSLSGIGGTTENAVRLAGLLDESLDTLNGATLVEKYDQVVNELAQNSTVAGSVADGLAAFQATLDSEFQAISGVNLDEEAVQMILLQDIYQATARYIATIQEMLDTLLAL